MSSFTVPIWISRQSVFLLDQPRGITSLNPAVDLKAYVGYAHHAFVIGHASGAPCETTGREGERKLSWTLAPEAAFDFFHCCTSQSLQYPHSLLFRVVRCFYLSARERESLPQQLRYEFCWYLRVFWCWRLEFSRARRTSLHGRLF